MGVVRGKSHCLVTQENERMCRCENVEGAACCRRDRQTVADANDFDIITAVKVNGCLHRAQDKSAIPALLNGHRSEREKEHK